MDSEDGPTLLNMGCCSWGGSNHPLGPLGNTSKVHDNDTKGTKLGLV
jgi:hypothetical protein